MKVVRLPCIDAGMADLDLRASLAGHRGHLVVWEAHPGRGACMAHTLNAENPPNTRKALALTAQGEVHERKR